MIERSKKYNDQQPQDHAAPANCEDSPANPRSPSKSINDEIPFQIPTHDDKRSESKQKIT